MLITTLNESQETGVSALNCTSTGIPHHLIHEHHYFEQEVNTHVLEINNETTTKKGWPGECRKHYHCSDCKAKTAYYCAALAYTSSEEGSASDIGIFLGDVTDPKVNCLRISLGLLTLHQPVTA